VRLWHFEVRNKDSDPLPFRRGYSRANSLFEAVENAKRTLVGVGDFQSLRIWQATIQLHTSIPTDGVLWEV
jgi:hypothetical protein